jgi:hypothetical protein
MRRVEATGQIVHQPVFFRLAGRLPLQHAFTGQAAAQLHNDLRLRSSLTALPLPATGRRTAAAARFERTSPISGQPSVFAHSATFLPSAALIRPRRPRRVLPPENQSRCFSLSRCRSAAARVYRSATSAELLLPLHAGIIHLAIQRFGERTVDMHTAGMQRAQRLIDRRDQPARGISCDGRGNDSVCEDEANIPGWRIA